MRLRALALILLVSLTLAPAAAAASGVLKIAGRVEVAGTKVSLLDLARNRAELDAATSRRLAAVTVMSAPALGHKSRLTGTRLRALLARADLPPRLTILIPATIEVRRAAQHLGRLELARRFREFLEERLRRQGLQARVQVVRSGSGLTLPAGRLETRVVLGSRRLTGLVRGRVEAWVDGRRVAQCPVSARVEVYDRVVVAARPLPRGHVLEPGDLKLQRRRLDNFQGAVARRVDDVVGLRTRNLVPMGSPIRLGRLERAPLIKRGQVVTMICRAGNLRVTAKGMAQQTGYKGSRIRLTNLASKRQVFGTVLDAGTVKVEF